MGKTGIRSTVRALNKIFVKVQTFHNDFSQYIKPLPDIIYCVNKVCLETYEY